MKSTDTMQENQRIDDIATISTEEWVSQVNDKLEILTVTSSTESERWKKLSVYRIPSTVIDLCSSKVAYKPQTVSIGPYHHGEPQLRGMEEHKQRALLHFLRGSGKSLQSYVLALEPMAEQLKEAYGQLDNKWKTNGAFLQLMIVDGCFILELLRTTAADHSTDGLNRMGYKYNDPVFSRHGEAYVIPNLMQDMLMLENQLPMQVLTTLLSVENGMTTQDTSSVQGEVCNLILKFFGQVNVEPYELGTCLHILDVYRKSLLEKPNDRNQEDGGAQCQNSVICLQRYSCCNREHENRGDEIIRPATELHEAGITIKPSKTQSLQDISFCRGVLKLPHIVVDDASESIYLNLMAFERFHFGAGYEVTSYVSLMDDIIDSARDVSLLHSSGIITNLLGDDKAVADMFNTISKDIPHDPNGSFRDLHQKVSTYCRACCPRLMASLRHNYFTNPWTGISVFAAIFLFALTGLQTCYTILSYYD